MGLLLNIGSGQRRFEPPWINADCVSRPGQVPDIVMNALEPWPWEDGSADMVVFHHVLEHFGCGEATPAIQEAWRVLAPGGSLLVFVPNMRALAQRWLAHQMDDQLYFTNVYGAYQGEQSDRHAWGFTFSSLYKYLSEITQNSVVIFDWRSIPGSCFGCDWWVLAVEVVK